MEYPLRSRKDAVLALRVLVKVAIHGWIGALDGIDPDRRNQVRVSVVVLHPVGARRQVTIRDACGSRHGDSIFPDVDPLRAQNHVADADENLPGVCPTRSLGEVGVGHDT